MILIGDTRHGKLVARAAGIGFDPEVDHCVSHIGIYQGELLGGVIYTNHTGRTVQMHMAGFKGYWATPRFMWVIYDFPFNCLKVEKVVATVPSTNRRSIDIVFKMGFQHQTSIPEIVRGGDMEIFSMSRAECRYLRLRPRFASLGEENAA